MQRETLDGVPLNFADAQWLARNCVAWETSVRSIGVLTGVSRACEHMPVYAPGNDYPNATAFAMDSVREYPPWFALNYEPAREDRDWYALAQFSPNACTGKPSDREDDASRVPCRFSTRRPAASHNQAFSAFNRRISACSADVTPGRDPPSISARRTHRRTLALPTPSCRATTNCIAVNDG